MIQKFSVKNCLSIRDEQVLDFVAASDDTYEDIMTVRKNNTRILKIGFIYGANASGKTNIILALAWLVKFLAGRSEKNMFAPFLLDDTSRDLPTEMALTFFVGDIRYDYSLTIQDETVLSEVMYRYPAGRRALVFDRVWNVETQSSEINFGVGLKLNAKQKYTLIGLTQPYSSVLGTYINNNIECNEILDELQYYFRKQNLPLLTREANVEDFTNEMLKKSPAIKDFILKILSQADFNISDILVKEEKTELPEEIWKQLQSMSEFFEGTPQRSFTENRLFYEHTTASHKEVLAYGAESIGTNRFYGMATYLFLLSNFSCQMYADEIEASLHYDLLRYFISLFLMNSSDSQLICSTHSLLLLDEPFVRRDCIHICRKDSYAATEVVRASEFGLRKDVSILRAYREGKLGGLPRLGGLVL